MRTNIEIDDALMQRALAAGPFKTKKEAVEAGLKLLERQAAYREIIRWRGKLAWGRDDEARLDGLPNWAHADAQADTLADSLAAGAAASPCSAEVGRARR
jgi:Arc/MetJ family transcription regulator